MRIYGVDFTSAPSRRKPVTAAACMYKPDGLHLESVLEFPTFEAFESFLNTAGPWIGGFDFPFGLPREAVQTLGWPQTWADLANHCRGIGRKEFTAASDSLRISRPKGNKYPKRLGDSRADSHSPMKCVRPPVGWMFLEGASRLVAANVTIPGMKTGDPDRIAVEAYPGFFARAIVARRSYKNDQPRKQTDDQEEARKILFAAACAASNPLGVALVASESLRKSLLEDGSGDRLDAAICALQAAWAWERRTSNYGLPATIDPLEGWIVSVPHS